jgi:uncharacterized protein YjbJ (UPF0337 family)
MRWDLIQMRWAQYRLLAKRRWLALTDAQLDEVCGLKELLTKSLQSSYGLSREAAERQIDSWTSTFDDDAYGVDDQPFDVEAAKGAPAVALRGPDPRRRSDPRR